MRGWAYLHCPGVVNWEMDPPVDITT